MARTYFLGAKQQDSFNLSSFWNFSWVNIRVLLVIFLQHTNKTYLEFDILSNLNHFAQLTNMRWVADLTFNVSISDYDGGNWKCRMIGGWGKRHMITLGMLAVFSWCNQLSIMERGGNRCHVSGGWVATSTFSWLMKQEARLNSHVTSIQSFRIKFAQLLHRFKASGLNSAHCFHWYVKLSISQDRSRVQLTLSALLSHLPPLGWHHLLMTIERNNMISIQQ